MDGWIGQPLKRREDPRLLTGAGRFVDDLRPPGCVHVVLLRSPHAHARITRLDVARARRAPGVVAVVTGAEVRHLGPMPVNRLVPDMRVPPPPLIPDTHVRTAGTPVAAIVAEDPYRARDAVELVDLTYEPPAALPGPAGRVAAAAPVPFRHIQRN